MKIIILVVLGSLILFFLYRLNHPTSDEKFEEEDKRKNELKLKAQKEAFINGKNEYELDGNKYILTEIEKRFLNMLYGREIEKKNNEKDILNLRGKGVEVKLLMKDGKAVGIEKLEKKIKPKNNKEKIKNPLYQHPKPPDNLDVILKNLCDNQNQFEWLQKLGMLAGQDSSIKVEFWDNTKLKSVGRIINNKREGIWLSYTKDGKAILKRY